MLKWYGASNIYINLYKSIEGTDPPPTSTLETKTTTHYLTPSPRTVPCSPHTSNHLIGHAKVRISLHKPQNTATISCLERLKPLFYWEALCNPFQRKWSITYVSPGRRRLLNFKN